MSIRVWIISTRYFSHYFTNHNYTTSCCYWTIFLFRLSVWFFFCWFCYFISNFSVWKIVKNKFYKKKASSQRYIYIYLRILRFRVKIEIGMESKRKKKLYDFHYIICYVTTHTLFRNIMRITVHFIIFLSPYNSSVFEFVRKMCG